VAPSVGDFREWCAAYRNLATASVQADQLVLTMRALTLLLAECKQVSATPVELAAVMDCLTQQAASIQASLQAVSDQVD